MGRACFTQRGVQSPCGGSLEILCQSTFKCQIRRSRHISAPSEPGASHRCSAPSQKSAIGSQETSAGTTSRPPDMPRIIGETPLWLRDASPCLLADFPRGRSLGSKVPSYSGSDAVPTARLGLLVAAPSCRQAASHFYRAIRDDPDLLISALNRLNKNFCTLASDMEPWHLIVSASYKRSGQVFVSAEPRA